MEGDSLSWTGVSWFPTKRTRGVWEAYILLQQTSPLQLIQTELTLVSACSGRRGKKNLDCALFILEPDHVIERLCLLEHLVKLEDLGMENLYACQKNDISIANRIAHVSRYKV